MSKVMTGGHLGHSDHEEIQFKISVDRRRSASKTSALEIRRADFWVLRQLRTKVPWENIFAGIVIYQCWAGDF